MTSNVQKTISPRAGAEGDTTVSPAKKKRVDLEDAGASVSQGTAESKVAQEIDETFYSRQLYVLGHEAMHRMATFDVLISGLGGLGVEIAKNVILSGVKSVTLHDDTQCTVQDLTSQFYLTESDIGKNRAEASLSQLSDLNKYVSTNSYTDQLTDEVIKKFKVVVLTNSSPEERLRISEVTHANNIALIIADTRGLFGQVFCDFGESFTTIDTTGKAPATAFIAEISSEADGIVTCLKESPHDFEDGDYVTFSEIWGMTELNNSPPRQITVLGRHTFSIGNTSCFSKHYYGTGTASQVKMPKTFHFKPLAESLLHPEYSLTDFAKCDRPPQLHLAFSTLHQFVAQHGALPRPWNNDDAKKFLDLAESLNTDGTKIDVSLLEIFAKISSGSFGPINAAIGGIVAQEVIKACSNKFGPIYQWLYFDALECLPSDLGDIKEEECQATGSRYDGQTAIFGKTYQDKLGALKYFVVGAGAIGCELLKNFAMMGVGAGTSGQVTVTDMDVIKKFNLNQQFLFRSADIQHSKSVTAASAALRMNPAMNVVAHENRVDCEKELFYDDAFFETLDGVANAVDNTDVREYIDTLCVYYSKPLLDSGTFGTMGSTQVVIPHLTESYNSSPCGDLPERRIPVMLKNFPIMAEHTLLVACRWFFKLFYTSPKEALTYLKTPEKIDRLYRLSSEVAAELLQSAKLALVDQAPSSFQDCVAFARRYWQEKFSNDIRQHLFNFPPNLIYAGLPFWTGQRRCPEPLEFSLDDPLHLDFVVAAANLKAEVYGIEQIRDRECIAQMVQQVYVPEYQLHSVAEQTRAKDRYPEENRYEKLRTKIPPQEHFKDFHIKALELDMDSDTNLQADFIVAGSRLLATCYELPPPSLFLSRKIIGRVIPAIVTTSSVVAGLACLELIKVVRGYQTLEPYKNGFFNLALPRFVFSEPVAPRRVKYNKIELTLWDNSVIEGEATLRYLLVYIDHVCGLTVMLVSQGKFKLYDFWAGEEHRERKGLTMTELWQLVSGKRLEPHERELYFQLECFDFQLLKEVQIPRVCYKIPIG